MHAVKIRKSVISDSRAVAAPITQLGYPTTPGQTVTLTSRHTRLEAHRFYKRMGYVDTGIRLVKELGDKA